MKLNNEHYFLTENTFDKSIVDKELAEIPVTNVYGHKQSAIYYASGAEEIESFFKPEGYIKKGYVTCLTATTKQIIVYFLKYRGERITELASIHIDRNTIIKYEIEESSDLIFVKEEAIKHKSKYMFNRGAGLLGSFTRLATEHMVSANTQTKEGFKFIIEYNHKKYNKKELVLYTSTENKDEVNQFLNTFCR